jgi:hypothetical protein
MPGGRGHMLRVLSGTQRGLFGRLTLSPDFLGALAGATAIAAPLPTLGVAEAP